MRAVLPAMVRSQIEARLPPELDVSWFTGVEEATQAIRGAEIAWVDLDGKAQTLAALAAADRLRWLFTLAAGVEHLDHRALHEAGVVLTNGSGLNSAAVAEYAVLGMLVAAKRYDEVVRLTDRREWTTHAPGRFELDRSSALIVGYGEIGRQIGQRLAGFGVAVSGATRSGRDGTLDAAAWRSRLGEFDWVVLAAPATGETQAMIGAAELAAMRPTAWLLNVGRGDVVDQAALVEALRARRIGGAFLDTVTPEPLPADDPLWSLDNCLLSMHLSGRSQTSLMSKAAELFLANLEALLAGRPMRNVVDLSAGY
jgi:phosphoglycerate dehydrogenase-like enzyme